MRVARRSRQESGSSTVGCGPGCRTHVSVQHSERSLYMSLRLAGTPALEPPSSSSFTLGVEEELFAVDPDDLAPIACSELLVRNGRLARGRITGEMCDGVVELATPICTDAIDATDALRDLRREVVRDGSPTLLGAGLHPTSPSATWRIATARTMTG